MTTNHMSSLSAPRLSQARRGRTRLNLAVDLVLIGSSLLVFASGLVLFTTFHVGGGGFTDSAYGIPHLIWLDSHRVLALIFTCAIALHVALHWKAFTVQLRRAGQAPRGGAARAGAEAWFYAVSCIVIVTGLAAWLLLPGSTPFQGPLTPGAVPHGRHFVIDIHNFSGLAALAWSVHHLAHRWRALANMMSHGAAPRRIIWLLHPPFPRHNRTANIRIDTSRCAACGSCIAACPQHALGATPWARHRHVHVDRSAACRGCLACVRACPQHAIQPRGVKPAPGPGIVPLAPGDSGADDRRRLAEMQSG
jgi:NAD-dependent dihydropyrimidine dehydrogenase PreA subunit